MKKLFILGLCLMAVAGASAQKSLVKEVEGKAQRYARLVDYDKVIVIVYGIYRYQFTGFIGNINRLYTLAAAVLWTPILKRRPTPIFL